MLLFPKLLKFCIGTLLGWRSRPHTPWDLCLCFSRLILDSSVSVDIACFSIKARSSRNHYSYKVRSTSFSVGLPRTLRAYLYAFWEDYKQYLCWFFSSIKVLLFHHYTMSCAHAHQSRNVAYACQGLPCTLAPFSRWLSFQLRSDFKQNSSVFNDFQ